MAKQREQILLEPEQKQKLQSYSDKTGIPKTEIVRRALDSWLDNGDWWDDLPQAVKDSIDQGIADGKAGRVTPHEEVRRQWL